MRRVNIIAVPGLPLIGPGDNLVAIIVSGLENSHISLQDKDIVVIAQKVVSKAEKRVVSLEDISPSASARQIAQITHKDEQLVEAILRESNEVLSARKDGLLVTEHRLGFICANAGVDRTNAAPPDVPGKWATLLPQDPDGSAENIRNSIYELTGKKVAVIINDTQGRPFREGAVGVAIGVAGLRPVADRRGQRDLTGYELRSTTIAIADEIASAASMVMGQAAEATPVVIIRGLPYQTAVGSAQELIRPKEKDYFRSQAQPLPKT